jgi:hypothetical protein
VHSFSSGHQLSQPSFETTPGCERRLPHLSSNLVSARVSNLDVVIAVSGITAAVAGELVDSAGAVVAVNNSTGSNPFTLTAPKAGLYRVNAGNKSPQRNWDSVMVRIGTTTQVAQDIPAHFALAQNYPNPFNPGTRIAFSLPNAAPVSLRVFDLQGREVAILADGVLQAGDHLATLLTEQQGSQRIYFYRPQAGHRHRRARWFFSSSRCESCPPVQADTARLPTRLSESRFRCGTHRQ